MNRIIALAAMALIAVASLSAYAKAGAPHRNLTTQLVLTHTYLQGGETALSAAECPSGFVATGGGYQKTNGDTDVSMSAPHVDASGIVPIGWYVRGTNHSTYDITDLTSYAICAQLP